MGGSDRIVCSDCGRTILRKNLKKHYVRFHPGVDPHHRMAEDRSEEVFQHDRRRNLLFTVAVIAVALLLVAAWFAVPPLTESILDLLKDEDKVDKRSVFYTSEDGAVINATWWDTGESGSPTVYLVHDIGGSREQWSDLAEELLDRGYNVLAMDLRGHGGSMLNIKDPDIYYDHRTMTDPDFLNMSKDFYGAYRWVHGDDLKGEPNTRAGDLGGMLGIGKGGLLAFDRAWGMSQKGMNSAVLISPLLNVYGMDVEQAVENWGDMRPIMTASSEGNGNTLKALRALEERTPEKGVHVVVGGTASGMELLDSPTVREAAFRTLEDGFSLVVPS